ncbi:hypothetical protein [Croceicoccus sp. BE223]|uniref:hypothetical protein n=1 Tax=Croceicoccus sp. BE223 TaxID=2817716 RepID=UPI002861F0B3|nr:hypothetical protein [Croceicoccus sp. BE223]MDR7101464.1 hypothetical protein [Croceicoccus sp. BE223]
MDRKELRDQAAHAAVSLLTVIPLVVCVGLGAGFLAITIAGIWAGLSVGMLAEVKERGSTVTWPAVKRAVGSWRDLGGYAAGGALIGLGAAMFRAAA